MEKRVNPPSEIWNRWSAFQSKYPSKLVLIDAARGITTTAALLTEKSNEFASLLSEFSPGDRIAFRLPNGSAWLAFFLALQRAGLAAVPLDGGMPEQGCVEMARHVEARGLYLGGELRRWKVAPRRNKSCCCVKLTSGTSAMPKVIECRPDHLIADGRQLIAAMVIRPRDINLAAIPFGHSYGLGNLVMPLLLQGTAIVYADHFVPRQLVGWIEQYRVTVLPGVPALFRVMAALPPGKEKLASLRTAISAGAVLTPAVARAFLDRFGIKIHNFYGSSETGGICYDRRGSASLTGRSVGKPIGGVLVAVTKERIVVKSPAVAARGGRWRLGDLGKWNHRGELMLLGRLGKEANIGGKKVNPMELERVLRGLPGVTDAVVWLQQAESRDLIVAGVETTRRQVEIERELAARVPTWKMPKTYLLVREFPRTARGKPDLRALQKSVMKPA